MKGNITRRGRNSWRIKFDLAPGPMASAARAM